MASIFGNELKMQDVELIQANSPCFKYFSRSIVLTKTAENVLKTEQLVKCRLCQETIRLRCRSDSYAHLHAHHSHAWARVMLFVEKGNVLPLCTNNDESEHDCVYRQYPFDKVDAMNIEKLSTGKNAREIFFDIYNRRDQSGLFARNENLTHLMNVVQASNIEDI